MYVDSEGIVIRQVKTGDGRRMILLFTRKYGKISAGTSINERGKNKSALAIRPFTYGHYNLFKNRDNYNIGGADVKSSFFKIGEDVDKFMLASYVLEFTEKLLPEEEPNERIFELLLDFFRLLSERKRMPETLVSGYMLRALKYSGLAPRLDACCDCGTHLNKDSIGADGKVAFCVEDGSLICAKCLENRRKSGASQQLIYWLDFGIVDILRYFLANSLDQLKNMGLDKERQELVSKVLDGYARYHLGVESFKTSEFL